ncbi:Double-strand break repair protein mre11a [Chytridiales sp. JEL 0842]|nr:Double-strand break repair protein mre11a [Chytridiales sp. JEL 0842]
MAEEDDTLRILVATDNHLGYMEKDPVRGNDSFESFEEILSIAKDRNVDFVLLGGDLFHDNKPSRKCLYKAMHMFRKYCMGDKPCQFDFLSAQDEIFKDAFRTVNYQDPNLNISMPVFSIHGNHDDPSGLTMSDMIRHDQDGDLCALDILSVAGLVNYFGRQTEVDDVKISPILLQKGETKLGLYGLGNIRDERLHRTFLNKKVKLYRPKEDADEWFNILVLHQNRVKRGPTNYVPEHFLDSFLHLVIWGHEHDCEIDLYESESKGFYISQPGSSVATSLSEGETKAKHVGLLEIFPGKQFHMEKIPLKTVRPFVMDDVILSEEANLRSNDEKRLNEFLAKKVKELISRAFTEWKEVHPEETDDKFPKPLVRLRVEYSNYSTINPQRFGQQFVDTVANVKDILHFYRRKVTHPEVSKSKKLPNVVITVPDKLDRVQVDDLVNEYLKQQNLEVLPHTGISNAVKLFVEKEDKEAIQDFVSESLRKTQDSLVGRGAFDFGEKDDNLLAEIRKEKENMESLETFAVSRKRRVQQRDDFDDDDDAIMRSPLGESVDDMEVDSGLLKRNTKASAPAKKASRVTKRKADSDDELSGDSRPKAAAKKTARGATKRKADSDDELSEEAPKKKTTAAKPRATRAAPAKKNAGGLKQATLSFGKKPSSQFADSDDDNSFSNFSVGTGSVLKRSSRR